jgi:hypothetical protein
MNLEERFLNSSNNLRPSTYAGPTQFNIDRSRLNIDVTPRRYSMSGRIYTAGDTSRLNIDVTPQRYRP